MNHATKDQKQLQSYEIEAPESLKAIQRNLDPDGLWATRIDGLKLTWWMDADCSSISLLADATVRGVVADWSGAEGRNWDLFSYRYNYSTDTLVILLCEQGRISWPFIEYQAPAEHPWLQPIHFPSPSQNSGLLQLPDHFLIGCHNRGILWSSWQMLRLPWPPLNLRSHLPAPCFLIDCHLIANLVHNQLT